MVLAQSAFWSHNTGNLDNAYQVTSIILTVTRARRQPHQHDHATRISDTT